MRIFEAAEIAVVEIRVAVEMDHPDRSFFGDRAQDGQAGQMVASDAHRRDGALDELAIEGRDARQGVVDARRVDRDIAEIGAAREMEGHDAGCLVQLAHHGGRVAQRARAMAGAGTIGRAPVPWNADEPDIDALDSRILERHMRQAHEGRDAGEARQHKT